MPTRWNWARFGAALLGLSFLTGCSWIRARGDDLADVVAVEWSRYPSGFIELQATDLCHSGLGWRGSVTEMAPTGGWIRGERRQGHEWSFGFLVFRYVVTRYRASDESPRLEGFRGGGIINIHHLPAKWADSADTPAMNPEAPWCDLFDVAIGVHAGVGGRVELSPGELVDFLLGWVGLDIGLDDDRRDGSPGREGRGEEAPGAARSPCGGASRRALTGHL